MAVSMGPCTSPRIVVQRQAAGAQTNCYLLYDPASLDAAIVDVAGPIDTLLAAVRGASLHVRYFLLTHGHFDHVIGLPAIRSSYPDALVCMHALDLEDMQTQHEWGLRHFGEETIAEWMKDPELSKIVTFDVSTFNAPDLFLEDGHVLGLGDHAIRVLHCPGHSRGSLCYSIDDLLFAGDVLFKGSVGVVDLQNGSPSDQIASVRRLYREFRDDIVVYPGHDESTTIGAERVGNRFITETEVHLS
jgi:glyoxylase-like metal-dependent hydrolase (beta-lactamase superfamily II)